MATSLGCLPSAIDEEPIANVFDLLDYWRQEPPTHVILAARYLGPAERRSGGRVGIKPVRQVSEADARKDMGELARMLGQQARPLPAKLKQLVDRAEALKQQHRGM